MLVVLAGVVYFESYLELMDRWWYEDDPALYLKAIEPANPLHLFTNPRYVLSFGRGNNVVPVQMLSYWIDGRIPHFSWWTANAHNLVSMLLVMLTLHHLVFRYARDPALAILIPIVWMMMPSTSVVIQYPTTRHYVEGFLLALWALIAFLKFSRVKGVSAVAWYVLFIVLTILSALAKEFYALTLPIMFGGLFLVRRDWRGVVICGSLIVGYALYRYWMVGTDVTVKQSYLTFLEYLHFLKVFPYQFGSNYLGYFFYAMAGGIGLLAIRKGGRPGILASSFLVAVILLNLAAIFPVSRAILMTVNEPGTWYRAVFFLHTLVLLGVMYLAWRFVGLGACRLLLLVAFIAILPGVSKTKALWKERTQIAEREGMYYLQHTQRLLYSEEAAHWFIRGLSRLYDVPLPNYINRYRIDPAHDQAMLNRFDTIWRFQDGEYKPDPALYVKLIERTREHGEQMGTANE